MAQSARIFRPTKNAMQSGRAGNMALWVLEFEPSDAKKVDSLMGWSGSADTRNQLRLRFESKEDAVAYADRNGLSYSVVEPQDRAIKPKNYADNFAYNRVL